MSESRGFPGNADDLDLEVEEDGGWDEQADGCPECGGTGYDDGQCHMCGGTGTALRPSLLLGLYGPDELEVRRAGYTWTFGSVLEEDDADLPF